MPRGKLFEKANVISSSNNNFREKVTTNRLFFTSKQNIESSDCKIIFTLGYKFYPITFEEKIQKATYGISKPK